MSSTTTTATAAFLDAYEPLDVIGNGSFGIIRKVRRKSDGLVFARKELNFERMSERDRKQIVAEVNILKDLHHSHIVRYHDRFVDRDAGILYILMEYCGGGDLSTVIKLAARAGRAIPEDTIWHYFYQILHALFHCHHPNSHGRSASGGSPTEVLNPNAAQVHGRRAQILHRDLKPDNVFLDENNTVKLGDFGLSKALAQASFANTYVGTPYYMSPELMQEKAYDSKSDIWSLGCLIYELCALKPPFHEAKTHAELSIFIRNGRIPPLPRGYSQALTSVIKSMLNLNPAMRPSAAQLLQHERLELVSRVAEAEKMLATVKSHRTIVAAKEREVLAREHSLQETQQHLAAVVQQKDQEIRGLREAVAQLQQAASSSSSSLGSGSSSVGVGNAAASGSGQRQAHQQQQQTRDGQAYTRADVERLVKDAVGAREAELRALVMQREAEVAQAIARREEEIMEAVRAREAEVDGACRKREEAVREEVARVERWREEVEREGERVREEVGKVWEECEERRREVEEREARVGAEEERLGVWEEELRRRAEAREVPTGKGRSNKNPLEEVKNTFDPSTRAAQVTPLQARKAARAAANGPVVSMPPLKSDAQPTPRTNTSTTNTNPNPTSLATPVARAIPAHIPGPSNAPFSAMKGVVLTATGETLATPSPAELVSLFERSPKVGLNFGRIFDFGAGAGVKLDLEAAAAGVGDEGDSPPPSPSIRKERGKDKGKERVGADEQDEETSSTASSGSAQTQTSQQQAPAPQANRRSTSRQQQHMSQPPPTRIRCPSIRTTGAASGVPKAPHIKSRSASSVPQSCSDPLGLCAAGSHSATCSATTSQQMKPLPHPHLRPSTSATNLRPASAAQSSSSGVAFPAAGVSVLPIPVPRTHPSPEYDFADEENLPSPFLKRVDKHAMAKAKAVAAAAAASSSNGINAALTGDSTSSSSTKTKRRGSSGLLLRAVAAANSAGRRNGASALSSDGTGDQQDSEDSAPHSDNVGGASSHAVPDGTRPTLASARKALSRP